MLALGALLYTVNVLSPPDPKLLSYWANASCRLTPTMKRFTTKPMLIGMAKNGAVGMVYPVAAWGARQLLVVKADLSRAVLDLPPTSLLAKYFKKFGHDARGRPTFDVVRFASVRLTRDGLPIATVTSDFSGAYGGEEAEPFFWSGKAWKHVPRYNAMPSGTGDADINTRIAAVDNEFRAAYNGSYAGKWHPSFDRVDDPTYLLEQAEFATGNKVIALGEGTVTGMNGDSLVGVQAGQNPWAPTCVKRRFASATRWSNGKAQSYGSGVAYAINASGQAVGDDELYFGTRGRPTLWRDGKSYVLDKRFGSAYAIADDGTIVGQIGSGGFIASSLHRDRALELLDSHLRDGRWHVVAAYDVARTGGDSRHRDLFEATSANRDAYEMSRFETQ